MDTVRILLVGDSHGDRESLVYLKKLYSDYDYLIHLGDSELSPRDLEGYLCVKGNHDSFPETFIPFCRILEILGHRIYICHGHKDFPRYFKYENMIENARSQGCDTIFFGHVHVCQDKVQEGIRLLNPGSVYHNRDGTHPSYMTVAINEDGIHAERIDYIAPSKMNEKKGFLEKILERLAGRD